MKRTHSMIANDWQLWNEYVNCDGSMTRDEFDSLTFKQRMQIMVDCFGAE